MLTTKIKSNLKKLDQQLKLFYDIKFNEGTNIRSLEHVLPSHGNDWKSNFKFLQNDSSLTILNLQV